RSVTAGGATGVCIACLAMPREAAHGIRYGSRELPFGNHLSWQQMEAEGRRRRAQQRAVKLSVGVEFINNAGKVPADGGDGPLQRARAQPKHFCPRAVSAKLLGNASSEFRPSHLPA